MGAQKEKALYQIPAPRSTVGIPSGALKQTRSARLSSASDAAISAVSLCSDSCASCWVVVGIVVSQCDGCCCWAMQCGSTLPMSIKEFKKTSRLSVGRPAMLAGRGGLMGAKFSCWSRQNCTWFPCRCHARRHVHPYEGMVLYVVVG